MSYRNDSEKNHAQNYNKKIRENRIHNKLIVQKVERENKKTFTKLELNFISSYLAFTKAMRFTLNVHNNY